MAQAGTFFNGTLAEEFDALVTSNGTVVTLALAKQGGGDMTSVIPGDARVLPAQSIALTAGSDAAPTSNYVYVLASAPTVLAKSTTSWPSANHIKIAFCLVPSATYVQSHGCYINQNWNDGTSITGTGQLQHLGENIRLTMGGASWFSGVAGNGATLDYITDTAGVLHFLSTAGVCYQMHKHTVPAFDSSVEEMLVVNSNSGPYTPVNDIATELFDSLGGSLNNKYYNIIFWMTANKTGEYAPVMMNMPTGSYIGLANAQNDVDGYDVYDMPREYNRESATGFLVCRITFRNQAGTVSAQSVTDLRGRTPGSASGITVGGEAEFADNQFKLFNVSDVSKIVDFDLSGLTTAITRTITPADANMKILSSVNHDDLTDGGDTTLHDHDGISENTTHRSSDGKDHSDVVLNNTHRASDGKDHSDVVLNNTHRGSDGKDHSDVVLNNTHRGSDGKNHSDVVLNNSHRAGDGSDHADVAANTAASHAESHTIASHSDTTATGAELDEHAGLIDFIPSGEKILFDKDTAVTGYSLVTTVDDRLVFITKGSAAGGQTGGANHSSGTWTISGLTKDAHTHPGPSHVHTMPTHVHPGPSHQHSGPSHTHTTGNFTLTTSHIPAHTHGSSGSHVHSVYVRDSGATQTKLVRSTNRDSGDHTISSVMPSGGAHTHTSVGSGNSHNHGATGADGTGLTGSAGTGDTGATDPGDTNAGGTADTGAQSDAGITSSGAWRPAARNMTLQQKT
jgi:hypothetical protein